MRGKRQSNKHLLWKAWASGGNICHGQIQPPMMATWAPGTRCSTVGLDTAGGVGEGDWKEEWGAQNSQGLKLPKIPKLGCRKHQNSQRRPLLMGTGSREREYLGKFHWRIILFSGMSPRVSEDFIILISEILKITERRCLLKPIALHFLAGFDLKHSKHIQQPLLPWRQRL